jgi:hypothetical protein
MQTRKLEIVVVGGGGGGVDVVVLSLAATNPNQ